MAVFVNENDRKLAYLRVKFHHYRNSMLCWYIISIIFLIFTLPIIFGLIYYTVVQTPRAGLILGCISLAIYVAHWVVWIRACAMGINVVDYGDYPKIKCVN
jgi:hypothetical protein